jgi:ribulose-5-phosphate 4-epimerase/fuculose-1-phosphate aldolase
LVTGWQLEENIIKARGMVRPSSESLTHAAVYELDDEINFVFHVHSPQIWTRAGILDLPQTAADCEYGTPEMAIEVARVAGGGEGIFVMAGHEDGVVAYGPDAAAPGQAIIGLLARAMACTVID